MSGQKSLSARVEIKKGNMKKLQIAILAINLAGAMSASAQVTITTEATMAPNGYGSPSYDTWAANGIYAMENGLTSYGVAGPAQFNVTTSPLPVAANFATGFNSWLGQAPGPYAGELGNRASFVAVINGNGSLINMNNFGFTMSSSDAGNALGYSWPNNSILPGDWTYDAGDIGLIFNNHINIAGGFTVVNSGDPGQMVNEIISIGAGNAYASYDTLATGDDDPNLGDTDQQILNYDIAQVGSYDFTGTFTYGDASGSATFDFTAVPEPTTAGCFLLGLGALACFQRFTQKRRS
jgi:hypothetical protein